MTDRLRTTPAVFVAVLDKNKVLLQLRQNTGWLDGWYDLPSGHLEPDETLLEAATRELEEESGLKASTEDLELFHISQNEAGPNGQYIYIMFRARGCKGVPGAEDPNVVSVGFWPLDDLPERTVNYVRRALKDINKKTVTFAYFGADGNERA